jgi:hypothetical protein
MKAASKIPQSSAEPKSLTPQRACPRCPRCRSYVWTLVAAARFYEHAICCACLLAVIAMEAGA